MRVLLLVIGINEINSMHEFSLFLSFDMSLIVITCQFSILCQESLFSIIRASPYSFAVDSITFILLITCMHYIACVWVNHALVLVGKISWRSACPTNITNIYLTKITRYTVYNIVYTVGI